MTTTGSRMIEAKRLSSGYWHISGIGPCNWAQPPEWPCDEKTLREHTFPWASEDFIFEAVTVARQQETK